MILLPVVLFGPFLAAALTPLLARYLGPRTGWWAAAVALGSTGALLTLLPPVAQGTTLRYTLPWVPLLDVDITFMVDGLSLFFALLISFAGSLIMAYGRFYLGPEENHGKFFAYMLLFMGSMLGVVLTGNLIALFVFWELTSLSSFLLIGFWDRREASRYGATKALIITAGGGIAMLIGFILLHQLTGSWAVEEALRQGEVIRSSSLYLPILGLVFFGCVTKSAQTPFHIWLPNAMEAPTPVSAYLHSAAMVKAGLYLVARLYPALSGTEAWLYLVGGVGLLTLCVGGFLALGQDDLKALLAYSTVSQLGLIMTLYGLGTRQGVVAGSLHLMNHAVFKAALFLCVGMVEHETGTRRLSQLGGLWRAMPWTGTFTVIAAAAMAGLPPLGGFVSKELFYMATLEVAREGAVRILFPLLAVLGSVLTFAYSLRLVYGVFFGRPGQPPRHPHEAPVGMRFSPLVLTLFNPLFGLWPAPAGQFLLRPMAEGILGGRTEVHLALWHGLGLPLGMSAAAIAFGLLLYRAAWRTEQWQERAFSRFSLDSLYDGGLLLLSRLGRGVSIQLQSGILRQYLLWILSFLSLLILFTFTSHRVSLVPAEARSALSYEGLLLALIIATAVAVVLASQPLPAVILLGGVGYLLGILFIILYAPDLALTQILIETVSLILFLLVIYRLPPFIPEQASRGRLLRDSLLATGVGGAVTAVLLATVGQGYYPSIADFFLRESLPGGGGRNVVNVILIDFRGYDTLGEITVLGIALLGVVTLLMRKGTR
ncbi:MAG: hydrogen gas-evolving membrane-bound hydrogenase subunit E [Candidatus Methylomirabilales bacterium]